MREIKGGAPRFFQNTYLSPEGVAAGHCWGASSLVRCLSSEAVLGGDVALVRGTVGRAGPVVGQVYLWRWVAQRPVPGKWRGTSWSSRCDRLWRRHAKSGVYGTAITEST